ncbi:uncharacterized protein PHACADRAFT_264910 [Phanerochaete carnosa HHB-10118-sp]|uniref:Uncharacterized protein n=1 Tax=Phanerochaete carnosa (strain HHB-10118-sp) TaxID=650164 RepID=K5VUS5_PHACS|nr:uncharacterized protein PHACADRAFT_264910 [Phanerochaete carnosa HHB-10118-sp]EKM50299.1 hypothetical protein PHACADRAFT_264910 [Phanerochaete carnosa HHB-10118-sp]
MPMNNTHATSPASPATTSTLAELHDLHRSTAWPDSWLETTNAPASDAPHDLRGVVQRDRVGMSDQLAERETKRDRLDAELFGAAGDYDGYATESNVEEDGQSSDDDSGYGGDIDSDGAQGQLPPVRRRVSPPLEHREYRVVSSPPTFLQNRGESPLSVV